MKASRSLAALLLVLLLAETGCSVVLVANRSSYRGDVKIIQSGIDRSAVIAELGQPDNFAPTEQGGFEDRYVLDPDAHRSGTKVGTALLYLAGDFFTLCLTELIFIPMEIAMKDRTSVFHLTYGPDGKLLKFEKVKNS